MLGSRWRSPRERECRAKPSRFRPKRSRTAWASRIRAILGGIESGRQIGELEPDVIGSGRNREHILSERRLRRARDGRSDGGSRTIVSRHQYRADARFKGILPPLSL